VNSLSPSERSSTEQKVIDPRRSRHWNVTRVSNRQPFPQAQNSLQVRHYLISGRVQGVGYRRFAEKQARQLQIGGWVRNLADGRVELVAEAEVTGLEQLELALRRGPMWAAVHELRVRQVVSQDSGSLPREIFGRWEPGEFTVQTDGETAVTEILESK
jgi:acylphosphatase